MAGVRDGVPAARLTRPPDDVTLGAVLETVVIDERFRGPPASANGGYTCGLVAAHTGAPAEVTLHGPPPIGRPLTIEERDGAVALLDGDDLVASGRPGRVDVTPPEPVAFGDAEHATAGFPWYAGHPFPTCFVCGPERKEGDGLRIFPGEVDAAGIYAAPWTPGADLADAEGHVRDEVVWAALDCPSGIATLQLGDLGGILLGRMAAELRAPVRAGEPHVLQAWLDERDGRKLFSASALRDASGAVLAVARATWIAPRAAA